MSAPVLGRLLRRVHARVVGGPDGRERGTTLVELVVGMILMTICGSIFTVAVVSLSRTSNQAQAITEATSQNNRAFQTLDRTVRYATAISTPDRGATSQNWYVEMRDTARNKEVCTQLVLETATGRLRSRTWEPTTAPTPTAWTTLAAGLTNGGTGPGPNQPFYLLKDADQAGSTNRQQLRFTLVSASGPANGRTATTSSFTLTAVNSTKPPPSGPICAQAGRP